MRFVYLLEDDPKFQREIVEAIQNVDSKIQIRIFKQLEEFFEWVKLVMQSGEAAIAKGGSVPEGVPMEPVNNEIHRLAAVISKVEFLGAKQVSLLRKTQDLFIKQKICTQEDPTAFVLTAFEEPHFKIKDLENRILNNVLMKPFDKLILTQHLTYAIDGRHPPSKFTIANQKTTAVIEMLKDVNMEAMSEVGFVTRSDQKLGGHVLLSKYYGKSFTTNIKTSLMAVMNECKEDPDKPGDFLCSFHYFGLSPSQISTFRKKIRNVPSDYIFSWESLNKKQDMPSRKFGVVILDENEQNSIELTDFLTRKFKSIVVTHYKSYAEMMMDLDPKLADSESQEAMTPAFPKGAELTLVFDQTGQYLKEFRATTAQVPSSSAPAPTLEAETKKPDEKADNKSESEAHKYFGLEEKAILSVGGWWQHHIGSEQMKRWRSWTQSPTQSTFVVEVDGHKFYIRPTTIEKEDKTRKLKVVFKELTVDEKYAFITENSKLPKSTDLILASHKFVNIKDQEKWNRVKELFKNRALGEDAELNIKIMMMSSRDYLDEEIRELTHFVNDIFYRPLDRIYLCQKIKFFFPHIEIVKEVIDFPTISNQDFISTASPVRISEISEAGLVMQYYRSIPPGEFRNFLLWQAYEVDSPRIVANCNYTEPSPEDKELFNNHFVFFGATDHFLKAVRIWMRDNYILSKEKG